jgi:hypothetical protein
LLELPAKDDKHDTDSVGLVKVLRELVRPAMALNGGCVIMRNVIILIMGSLLSSCSAMGGLRTDLSASTIPTPDTERALINNLMKAFDKSGPENTLAFRRNPSADDIEEYVQSGFTLTDIYCDEFFRRTNLSYRKRKFGRGATNDVGTVVASVLGLSNVGPKVIAGVATGFGLADSTWRNYDESFIVSPEIDVVRSLVLSAQDQFRRETFDNMPDNYMSARSAVIRYAGLCSFLGMQALMNQSVDQQRRQLQEAAKPVADRSDTAPKPDAAIGAIPQ